MNELIQEQIESELTLEEKRRLTVLEGQIRDNLFGFRQVNAALLEIHDKRLYRGAYHSFESYLKSQHATLYGDISRHHAWRIIEHERTLQAFEAKSVPHAEQKSVPQSLRQSEALASLPAQDRPAAFELAQELTGKEQPSGKEVADVVNQIQPSPTEERISRLDTGKVTPAATKTEKPAPKREKYSYGWGEDLTVSSAGLVFTARRPDFTSDSGKVFKTKFPLRLHLHQLASLGFIHENDEDSLQSALDRARRRRCEEEAEESAQRETAAPQKSFIANMDFDHLDGGSPVVDQFFQDYPQ